MAIPRNLANIAPSVAGNSDGVTGITFAATQSASADANTLDDYEEGTWTPTFGSSDGTIVLTYQLQIGFYTKIGNVVKVAFQIVANSAVSAGPTTGNLQIRGLPFTSRNTSGNFVDAIAVGFVDGFSAYGTSTNTLGGLIQPNGNYIYIWNYTNAVQGTHPTPAALKQDAQIRATAIYTVA